MALLCVRVALLRAAIHRTNAVRVLVHPNANRMLPRRASNCIEHRGELELILSEQSLLIVLQLLKKRLLLVLVKIKAVIIKVVTLRVVRLRAKSEDVVS